MATLTKRRVKGHIYYYFVESQRMDGKPRWVLLLMLRLPQMEF